ncbi:MULTISPECIES: helix-turn-helix domain-containing protein [unclassified Blastococcus]
MEPLELRPGLALLPVGGPLAESVVPPAVEHRVYVNVGRPYRLLETLGDAETATPGLPGDVAVVPAGLPFAVRSLDGVPQPVTSLVVTVAPALLDEVPAGRRLELLPVVGARSPAVSPLAGLLHTGLADRSDLGRLALDALATALVAALARDHTAVPPPAAEPRGLSRAQLARVTRHVEDHLAQPLTVAGLAALAHVSEFHFSRQFRAATGSSPHRYVLGRRVARARELLVGTDVPIAAVAARCGFADAGHLTRHVRRALGATPAAVRAAARGR